MNELTPIPNKIFDFFQLIEKHNDIAVKGKLKCSCGNESFNIQYFGKQSGIFSPNINKENTEKGKRILLCAKCSNCSKKIMVFDSATDGNENNNNNETPSQVELSSFNCKKCEKSDFSLEIAFNSYGKDELTKQGKSNWKDCFSMIIVSGECVNCGKKYKGLVECDC